MNRVSEIKEFTSGLINRSYYVRSGGGDEFVLQRINKEIFEEPEKLMLNILIINDELRKIEDYRVPEILLTTERQPLYTDAEGHDWRVMRHIPNSMTYDATEDLTIGAEVGRIIGKFHCGTVNCDLNSMHVTLPNFHGLDFRVEWFLQSLQKANHARLTSAHESIPEVEQLIEYFSSVDHLELPTRVTHNDTKLNNVLFDRSSGKALCLIDLDTIMPGHIFHDFGDAVRTLCNAVQEGDPNLEAVEFQHRLFVEFLQGYVSQTGGLLTDKEWDSLPLSIEYMPFIMAVRFLTDYLFGDRYYKVDFPDQNLIRCQNQLKFISELRRKRDEIKQSIEAARKAFS